MSNEADPFKNISHPDIARHTINSEALNKFAQAEPELFGLLNDMANGDPGMLHRLLTAAACSMDVILRQQQIDTLEDQFTMPPFEPN